MIIWSSRALGSGSPEVRLTRFPKIAMVMDVLDLGFDLLMQDIDLVWFRDPVPPLRAEAKEQDVDFQFMRDVNPLYAPLLYNSGFVYVRSNERSRSSQ